MAGYSSTPLAKKLGIKEGFNIRLINEPSNYFELFTDFPVNVNLSPGNRSKKDFIHFFTKELKELNKILPKLSGEISSDGMIWVSWPKKAAGIQTDVTENLIREVGLASGLVDIKVCAVDDTWSGLKFVIPVKDRKK